MITFDLEKIFWCSMLANVGVVRLWATGEVLAKLYKLNNKGDQLIL